MNDTGGVPSAHTPASADQPPRRAVRVLVGIGINPDSQRLLQTAFRLAQGLGGELLALHIQPPGNPTRLYRANLERHLQQARDLGARVEVISGHDIATTLVHYGRIHQVTHLVVGQSDVSRWHEVTRGSIVNRLLRLIQQQQAGIDLYVVTSSSRS